MRTPLSCFFSVGSFGLFAVGVRARLVRRGDGGEEIRGARRCQSCHLMGGDDEIVTKGQKTVKS